MPPAVHAARGRFLSDRPNLAECGAKLHSRELLASDDLADSGVIEVHQLTDLSE